MRVADGDTDRVAFGIGTMGSRSTVIGGPALYYAADKVIERRRGRRPHAGSGRDRYRVRRRRAVAGTDRSVRLTGRQGIFFAGKITAGVEPGLFETATFAPDDDTYPNGSHVCEVEIDPETGETDVVGYWVVDDVGVMVNPVIVKGQIHGGVAQGVGRRWANRSPMTRIAASCSAALLWTTGCRVRVIFQVSRSKATAYRPSAIHSA